MKISPARVAAFDVLKRIETERAFSSVLLPEYEADLSAQDRSLCHGLVLGVLRRQMLLDRQMDHFSGGKKIDIEVRISLRLGLYQLQYLDRIPAHSAVNESVSLVQRAKKSSARGFVNAILRGFQRELYRPVWESELERIAVETSHPEWLIEKWISQFGPDEAAELAAANNQAPPISYRFTAKSRSVSPFPSSGGSDIVPGTFTAPRLTPELADASAAGEIYFQDEASQLVASLIDPPDRGSVLDVCAAPGSKITFAAAKTDGNAHLVAGDLHHHRTRFLLENCRGQAAKVSVVEYDAEKSLPFDDESFDLVLVDAPCSGTGTIRHNPEIRYFLRPEDFEDLSRKQLRILRNASKLVKRGSVLIYSTCSLETEENEAVASGFQAKLPDFISLVPPVEQRFITANGHARTVPHRDRMDGFFIAMFARTGEV